MLLPKNGSGKRGRGLGGEDTKDLCVSFWWWEGNVSYCV